MNFERIKEFTKFFSLTNKTLKLKISLSCSLIWIVVVGYLTWWNGLSSRALDKSFQWDEWFWFGIIPATIPYFFYFVWKIREDEKLTSNKNFQKNVTIDSTDEAKKNLAKAVQILKISSKL